MQKIIELPYFVKNWAIINWLYIALKKPGILTVIISSRLFRLCKPFECRV